MKKSKLTFAEGFLGEEASIGRLMGNQQLVFDWDKAGLIINERFKQHKDLLAEAGLQEDWEYTGGEIFEDGKPVFDSYTYLSSNWAKPTLILSWDGEEREEMECFSQEDDVRFDKDSKWDAESLKILKSK